MSSYAPMKRALGHHLYEISKAEPRRYQRTQRMMISRSKWRPLKRSRMFRRSVMKRIFIVLISAMVGCGAAAAQSVSLAKRSNLSPSASCGPESTASHPACFSRPRWGSRCRQGRGASFAWLRDENRPQRKRSGRVEDRRITPLRLSTRSIGKPGRDRGQFAHPAYQRRAKASASTSESYSNFIHADANFEFEVTRASASISSARWIRLCRAYSRRYSAQSLSLAAYQIEAASIRRIGLLILPPMSLVVLVRMTRSCA
jgi:hypothetical protein